MYHRLWRMKLANLLDRDWNRLNFALRKQKKRKVYEDNEESGKVDVHEHPYRSNNS